ncbi:hypothetical protein PR048_033143 [Dryococelus australis]|uniref:Uncharacterized protein n=1 Tax=Dryococelus australis TaxID=614101 RepID=A0ABQ9G0D5_9NEOP|nr:hypothetical protein PR048_033143 [Dryococelus australis]
MGTEDSGEGGSEREVWSEQQWTKVSVDDGSQRSVSSEWRSGFSSDSGREWLAFISLLAERLARSPPTKTNLVQSPAGSPDFRKWESCRTTLVGGISQGSLVSPAPSFRRRPILTPITLIGSQDLAVKRRLNLFTHSLHLTSSHLSSCEENTNSAGLIYVNMVCVPWVGWGDAVGVVVRPIASYQRESDSIPDRVVTCRNRAVRCRRSVGFLADLPFPLPLHSSTAPFLPRFALKLGFSNIEFAREAEGSEAWTYYTAIKTQRATCYSQSSPRPVSVESARPISVQDSFRDASATARASGNSCADGLYITAVILRSSSRLNGGRVLHFTSPRRLLPRTQQMAGVSSAPSFHVLYVGTGEIRHYLASC